MSLNTAIANLNTLFFSKTNFAEDAYHWPGGDSASKVLVQVVTDWAEEEGQNNVRGDGRSNLNEDRGRSIRRSVKVEVPVSVSVSEDGLDRFELMDPISEQMEVYSVKRILGRDAGSQTILCVRNIEITSQKQGRRG